MHEHHATFDEFWDHYLREHGNALNRRLHVLGTTASLATAAFALAAGKPKRLLLVPLVGYAPAWAGHFLVERNHPATFARPLWSVRADLKMWRLWVAGQLEEELARIARIERPAVPDRLDAGGRLGRSAG